jgi:uncharacterized protein (TIGR02147 family)
MISIEGARSFCAKVLSEELDRRAVRNGSYSLRAFARDLGVSAATLSNILGGKQSLSKTLAEKISHELSLPESSRDLFLQFAEFSGSRSPSERSTARTNLKILLRSRKSNLDLDAFAIIQNPWHFAVLESLKLKTINGDPEKISKFLRLELDEVLQLLSRLESVGLVRKNKKIFEPTGTATHTFPAAANHAVQNFHAAVLSLGIASMKEKFESRTFVSLVTACSSADMESIERKLTDFLKNLEFEIESSKSEKDDIYALGLFNFSLRRQ